MGLFSCWVYFPMGPHSLHISSLFVDNNNNNIVIINRFNNCTVIFMYNDCSFMHGGLRV